MTTDGVGASTGPAATRRGMRAAAFCAALRWRARHEGGINRWLIEKTGGLSGIV